MDATDDIDQIYASHVVEHFARELSVAYANIDSQDNAINYTSAVSGGLVLIPQGKTLEALAADYAKMVIEERANAISK